MPEGILFILIIVGVIGLTVVVFGGWVMVTVLRGIFRVMGRIFFPLSSAPVFTGTAICARPSCRAPNPARARFCHRCGLDLSTGRDRHVVRARVA